MKRKSILIIAIWVLIIFSFSLQSGMNSTSSSTRLKDDFAPIVHALHLDYKPIGMFLIHLYHDYNLTPGTLLVRKVAHLTEYMVLGLIVSLVLKPYRQKKRAVWLFTLLTGPIVSVCDEFIVQQFISHGRTPSPFDVCVDSLGFLLGTAIIFCCHKLSSHFFRPQVS